MCRDGAASVPGPAQAHGVEGVVTRYDEPGAGDGRGGPHPLAGVPQEALDAAARALWDAGPRDNVYIHIDRDDHDSVAHAVLLAALVAARAHGGIA